MDRRDVVLLLATWLVAGAVILLAVVTEGGDYPPAPVEMIR